MIYSLIFYWSLAIVVAIFASKSVSSKNRIVQKLYASLTIIIPSFFAAIRYSAGTDTLIIYKVAFELNEFGRNVSIGERMEMGFYLLNKLVRLLSLNFQVLLFLCCFITIFCIYKGLVTYKERISVGIGMWVFMMLFYQLSFNAMRQVIAISILFYALKYIDSKNYVKSILSIVVAYLFHKTSLVYFMLLILRPIFGSNKNRFIKYMIYTVIFILILNFSKIQGFLLNFESLSYYANSYLRVTDTNGITIGFFIRTIPFLLPAILLSKEEKNNSYFQLVYGFTMLGSILRLFAYVTNTYAERIAYNFLIFEIALVAYYFYNIKKYRKVVFLILIAFTMFLSYYDYFYLHIGQTVPYDTIWGGRLE